MPEKSGDPNEVVAIYTTTDVYEAEIIRDELRNEGISCELDGTSQGGFTELVTTKLLVRAWDADRARKLIDKRQGDKFAPPENET